MKLKKGDKVRSKKYPEIEGEIVNIKKDRFTGKSLYVLDLGGRYFADELELI